MTATNGVPTETLHARCCITGGGPAGMMLGYLLARAGVDVVVLEKHTDFLRDFRGDTIHPSTLEVIHELGLLDEFLARPHQETRTLGGVVGDVEVPVADFSRLPLTCKFLAFMPQWDFLDFVAEHARRLPEFRLRMGAEVVDLIEERGAVVGVRVKTADGPLEVLADLTVGADGRHSTIRRCAGLAVEDIGAPIDVLWMRLPRHSDDPTGTLGRFRAGQILIMIDREDYWQCGYIIPKGGYDALHARGLEAFHNDLAAVAPFLRDRLDALADWDAIKLLTVTVDRLRHWSRAGLLCIGDSAHAMSPVGGVGINLAIQDAVATANLLARPLREGTVTVEDLEAVQRRRSLPTRLTQRLQVLIQDRVLGQVLGDTEPVKVAWPFQMLRRFPALRAIPARLVGMGFRPEHVKTPDASLRDAAPR